MVEKRTGEKLKVLLGCHRKRMGLQDGAAGLGWLEGMLGLVRNGHQDLVFP